MGKRSIITPQRLQDGADRAKKELFKRFCTALKHNGVDTKVSFDCTYKGTVQEDAPLHSTTRVIYTWRVDGKDTEYETLACKFCHNSIKICAPRALKNLLVKALLPEVIVQRRLIPGMQVFEADQLQCHGIAVPRPHVETYETVYLLSQGKRVQHVKLAHIAGDEWQVHPGKILTVTDMFPATVKEESAIKEQNKTNPIAVLMQPMPQCELRSKLFAVATFRAEVARAKAEGRDIIKENAYALFDTDLDGIDHLPRQVFVLWSAITSEGRQEYVSEMMMSNLYNRRGL